MDINYPSGYTPFIPENVKLQTLNAAEIPLNAQEVPAETTAQTIPTEEIISQTLLSYGYKVTEENKEMLLTMLEKGIPLTKEDIARMYQAFKLTGTLEKAMFMLENTMRLTQNNAAQLEGLVSGQTKITSQINNLLSLVEQLSDPDLAKQIKQILFSASVSSAENSQKNPVLPQNNETAEKTVEAKTAPLPQTNAQTNAEIKTTNLPQANAESKTAPLPQATVETKATALPQTTVTTQTTQPTVTAPPPQSTETALQADTSQNTATALQADTSQNTATALSERETPQKISVVLRNETSTVATAIPETLPVPEKILFKLEESTPQNINDYFRNLREMINEIRAALPERETPEITRFIQELRTIETQIDFTSQIRNQIYMQLPLIYNGELKETALHIYKDKKKSAAKKSDTTSALIALDTAALGHFETYVQKNSNGIQCQFRLENDEIVQTVRNNIHKLSALLSEHGYSLEGFSFLPHGEPYTVLDNPKTITNVAPSEISRFDEMV